MKSPFEQFEIIPIQLISLEINNIFITLLLNFFLTKLLTFSLLKSLKIIPINLVIILELIYNFILSMILEQIGNKGKKYLPIMFFIFKFILISNLIGVLPFGFTLTSHIIVTGVLAGSMFIGITIIGIKELKLNFINLFIPKGIPKALLPLLILIELMSYLIRPISLAIRLFANMLAGHVLLHIIAAFIVGLPLILCQIVPNLILMAFMVLEIGIAFLQAYVFTILLLIYFKDSLYGH